MAAVAGELHALGGDEHAACVWLPFNSKWLGSFLPRVHRPSVRAVDREQVGPRR